jgi:hypothetical protein
MWPTSMISGGRRLREHRFRRVRIGSRSQLGGEAFGDERRGRRVRDIRRRAPFFADLGEQPSLDRGVRPLLLRMIVSETAGLENDWSAARLPQQASLKCTSGRPGLGIASCRSASPVPSAGDACGSDAEERRRGNGRRFRRHNGRASSGRRRQNTRASGRATALHVRSRLAAWVCALPIRAMGAPYHGPPAIRSAAGSWQVISAPPGSDRCSSRCRRARSPASRPCRRRGREPIAPSDAPRPQVPRRAITARPRAREPRACDYAAGRTIRSVPW